MPLTAGELLAILAVLATRLGNAQPEGETDE